MKRSSSYRSRRKSKFNFIKTAFKAVLILALLAIATIILTPSPYFKDGFKNLKELQAYANQTNEQTPMENADTLRPEFTNYYKSQIPTFSQKIKNKINLLLYLAGVKEKPVWSVSFLKTILENTEKSRKNAGHTDNLIYKIQTDPTSKFVIFGNMQGAFHSLVRCLNKIKELGIIGDDLKVTNSNNYIIFMGDLVDRSPFTLEILTLALKLIEANPQNVIYLRGNHEAKDYWQEHTLKTELQIRAAHLSKETIPLQKEVSSFFNTLPIAVYLTVPNKVEQSQIEQSIASEFIRISQFARSENEILNEINYADFLTKQQSSKFDYLVIKEPYQPKPNININIKASIHNEKKRKTFQKSEGLRLLAPDMDSVSWNILSCPTIVYQKALDFYSDAFVILSASANLENWEISLYSRDIRTKDPFKETRFNFLSGLDINSHKTKIVNAQPATKPQIQQPTPQHPQGVQSQIIQLPQTASTAQQTIVQQPQVVIPVQQLSQQTQTTTQAQQTAVQQSHGVQHPQVITPAQQQQIQAPTPAPQVVMQIPQQHAQATQATQQPIAPQQVIQIPVQQHHQVVTPIPQHAQTTTQGQQPQIIVPAQQRQTQPPTAEPQVIVQVSQQPGQANQSAQQQMQTPIPAQQQQAQQPIIQQAPVVNPQVTQPQVIVPTQTTVEQPPQPQNYPQT